MGTRLTGSDVKAVNLTADTVALDADGLSVAASVGNNAALVMGGALTSGGSATFSHGRVVTILSAGDDSAISFTVTGTDVNGDAQTESITGANAGTATGSKYFLTISGISAVGNPAGNVSAGVCTGTAGVLDFLTTSPTGTSIYKVGTVASATATRDLSIPDEGMVFSDGIYVQYTVSTFNTLTVFRS